MFYVASLKPVVCSLSNFLWGVGVRLAQHPDEEEAPMYRVAQAEGRLSIAYDHDARCPTAASLPSVQRYAHFRQFC